MTTSNPLISIVVPVYNVEGYLRKCVNSISSQSYDNLQIILIDDGSTDQSGSICDDLSAADPRILVFHTPNQGLSGARNYGMKQVTGDYVLFVDSDDYIGIDHVDNLHKALLSNPGTELAITGRTSFFDGQEKVKAKQADEPGRVLPPAEALSIAIGSTDSTLFREHAWGKLYHKTLYPLLEFPIGKLYEDRYVFYKVVLNSSLIAYENSNDYFYLADRSGSIMNNVSLRHFDCLKATEEMLEYTQGSCPEAYPYVLKRYYSELLSYFGVANQLKETSISDELFSIIKSFRSDVLTSSATHLSTKIAYAISYLGKYPLEAAVKINNRLAAAVDQKERKAAIASESK